MPKPINSYYWFKNQLNSNHFILSLILVGIFLLPNIAFLSTISDENIIVLTNKEREKAGLSALSANQLLTKAAIQKSRDIINSQAFQHNINGRKFSSWVRDAGYEYSYTGENLAIDFYSAEGVLKAWLNSPSHKKNLLNENFTEIGVAVVEAEFENQKTLLVVQVFGAPLLKNLQIGQITPNNSITRLNAENLLTHTLSSDSQYQPSTQNMILAEAPEDYLLSYMPHLKNNYGYSNLRNIFLLFAFLLLVFLSTAKLHHYFPKNKNINNIIAKANR